MTASVYIQVRSMIGIELGGALKNVIALAAGILDGMGLGDNTKAALMTRGIAEISRLGVELGGKNGNILRFIRNRRFDCNLYQHPQPES